MQLNGMYAHQATKCAINLYLQLNFVFVSLSLLTKLSIFVVLFNLVSLLLYSENLKRRLLLIFLSKSKTKFVIDWKMLRVLSVFQGKNQIFSKRAKWKPYFNVESLSLINQRCGVRLKRKAMKVVNKSINQVCQDFFVNISRVNHRVFCKTHENSWGPNIV